MIYYTNETDEAIRDYYELNDDQYQFYRDNRKWILERIRDDQLRLRESKDLKCKFQNLELEAKNSKKRNSADVLEYNVAIQYMDGSLEPTEVPQIAEMIGCTTPLIRQYKSSAYEEMKRNIESNQADNVHEFKEETQILMKGPKGQWQN